MTCAVAQANLWVLTLDLVALQVLRAADEHPGVAAPGLIVAILAFNMPLCASFLRLSGRY